MTFHQWVLLITLYAAQGLPYGFLTQAVPVLLRESGQSLEIIGLASLMFFPWALKFLWAPLLDRYGSNRLGHRRSWIIPLQFLTAACLLFTGFLDAATHLHLVGLMLLVINTLSATQDIATDALAVEMLSRDSRGLANGIQVGAYRAGMIVGGGILLMLFSHLHWRGTFVAMGILVGVLTLPILLHKEQNPQIDQTLAKSVPVQKLVLFLIVGGGSLLMLFSRHSWPGALLVFVVGLLLLILPLPTRKPQSIQTLTRSSRSQHFVFHPGAGTLLTLLFLFKFGDALASAMMKPWMVDHRLSMGEIGWLVGTVGSIASLAGAMTGGWLSGRISRKRALLLCSIGQCLALLAYALISISFPEKLVLTTVIALEHFAGGMATAALFTCMMDFCRPGHSGSDYTVQASTVVISSGIATTCSGILATRLGYQGLFILAFAFGILAVIAVGFLFPRRSPLHTSTLESVS